MRPTRGAKLTLLVAGIAVLAAGGLAIASVQGSSQWATVVVGPMSPSPSEPPVFPTSAAPAPALSAAFAVLREPRDARDVIPASLARDLAGTGANGSLSRRVQIAGSDGLVIPSGAGLCVVTESRYACTTTEKAVAGALIGTDVCLREATGRMRVFGLVPDGIKSVRLDLADGTVQELPVIANVYGLVLPREPLPLRLRWTSAAESRGEALQVPVPPGVEALSC